MAEGLDAFCGSPYWDYSVTWNTTDPDFTECFQRTVLIWVPCAFLWLFAPLEVHFLLRSKSRQIPWSVLNITKLVITSTLVILKLIEMAYSVNRFREGESLPYVNYYAPFILFGSLILAEVFTVLEKKRGIQSSGVMFNFWALLTLAGLVTYRTLLLKATDEVSYVPLFPFVLYMIYYPLVVAMLILSCIADCPPTYKEFDENDENPCPEENSSFLSKLLFSWFDSMAWYGYRHSLERKDLWALNAEDKSKYVVPSFERRWKTEVQNTMGPPNQVKASFSNKRQEVDIVTPRSQARQPSLIRVLFKTYGVTFLYGGILKLISDMLTFVSPLVLELLINFVSTGEPMWRGYLYAALIFLGATAQSIILNKYFYMMFMLGLQMRTAMIATIYKKSLRLSNSARKSSTVGEIVNLMSVDAQKLMDLIPYLHMIWSAPLQIVLAMYFLWTTLGPSVLAGLAIMVLLIPLNGLLANYLKKLQLKQMKAKDERVKIMNEVLNGMKVLKLYAWEPSFEQQVQAIRGKELNILKTAAYLGAATSFVWMCAPFVVTLATFATYVLVDENNILDATKAFVSLSIFNIIRMPMSFIPMLLVFLVQSSVSLKRINKYLCHEELNEMDITHNQFDAHPINVHHSSFSWGAEEEATLKNINLHVKEGDLVAVVGTVGSGKSSLISALLGEMDKLEGTVNVKGSVAYAAQQAWIQNATLRDNILFGKSYDQAFYERCVDACALRVDLNMLPAGDQTEIGEKGINLSGGQKQRVSLARAVYNNAKIYMLDDPLSAVDAHVGKHIFENVIGSEGMLKGKTRILVTHAITYLPRVDLIIVMNNGAISEVGTYQQLLERKGAFADFLMNYLGNEDNENLDVEGLEEMKDEILAKIGSPDLERQLSRQLSRSKSQTSDDMVPDGVRLSFQRSTDSHHKNSIEFSPSRQASKAEAHENNVADGKIKDGATLISKETVETGQVKLSIYWYYFQAVGVIMVGVTLALNLLSHACSVGSNLWLSAWSNDKPLDSGEQDIALRDLRLGIYGLLGFLQALCVLVAAVAMAFGSIRASRILHNDMLGNVLRSPMSFFDTTPLGRIVNRFGKDVDVVDASIPVTIRSWLMCALQVVATIVVICISTPIFVVVILPLSVVYYFIQTLYVATSRQLKRLESASRSPIYSHFSETVTGASTIRAYGKQQDFILLSENKVDENQISYFPSVIANRWLAIRLEFVGNMVVFAAALFSVLGKDTLSPGIVGLSVSYALSLTATLNWMVRMSGELETNIVAVERMKEYAITPTEAEWRIQSTKPNQNWPQEGVVNFEKYTTRYREGLELVVKGITFHIKGGEKVGIVGRTGAGKSSLTLALFRIIEPVQGSIIIDGVDITKIGLHDLRTRLTIIPQDPVLFSGSLRINLDPFNMHSDDDIWKALELSHLKTFVSSLSSQLSYEISEGGENLSVGQRQLVCLARALLRKTKILVLDEATAAVDIETDELIQATIRKEFAECTVLTIAHRLNTIMDSNRILVLDKGTIKEFDTPENLLKNKESLFYGMVNDAGLA